MGAHGRVPVYERLSRGGPRARGWRRWICRAGRSRLLAGAFFFSVDEEGGQSVPCVWKPVGIWTYRSVRFVYACPISHGATVSLLASIQAVNRDLSVFINPVFLGEITTIDPITTCTLMPL